MPTQSAVPEATLRRDTAAGFTLIEMAVAVFIIGLLLGGVLVPLNTQVQQRQIRDTEILLAQARDALIGFAVTNGYLPCPDLAVGAGSNDGLEDVTGGITCTADAGGVSFGLLPVATLNLPTNADPWRNRIRYRLVSAYGVRPSAITTATNATLRVCTSAACGTILTNSANVNDQAVFVLISHGRNAYGGISAVGEPTLPATSADELANVGPGNAVSRTPTGPGAINGEFDDIVLWLGRSTLNRNLISAGRLP